MTPSSDSDLESWKEELESVTAEDQMGQHCRAIWKPCFLALEAAEPASEPLVPASERDQDG